MLDLSKIGNHKQIGGIETSVLDNGAGAGVRIAWIDTGSGFRYKIVLDRGMDIAEAVYNDCSLAWIGHVGTVRPQALAHIGTNWLRTFGGGLLVTCGLDQVGGAESDAFGERGIHGEISNIPTELLAIKQPNHLSGDLSFSITGIMRQHKIFGPCLTLKRTISGTIGKPELHISDEVMNEGNQSTPLMLLYHFNFGYPLLDEGAEISYQGAHYVKSDPKFLANPDDLKTVPAPSDLHSGTGESVIVVDVSKNKTQSADCALWNPKRKLGIQLTWNKDQLPYLSNWQHYAEREYVTGLEPGTHPPIGQKKAREDGNLIFLKPLESRTFEVSLQVIHTKPN